MQPLPTLAIAVTAARLRKRSVIASSSLQVFKSTAALTLNPLRVEAATYHQNYDRTSVSGNLSAS